MHNWEDERKDSEGENDDDNQELEQEPLLIEHEHEGTEVPESMEVPDVPPSPSLGWEPISSGRRQYEWKQKKKY